MEKVRFIYFYDSNYRATDIEGSALSLHFTRDAMGNIIAEGILGIITPSESYHYDPLYRLQQVDDATVRRGKPTHLRQDRRLAQQDHGWTGHGYAIGCAQSGFNASSTRQHWVHIWVHTRTQKADFC